MLRCKSDGRCVLQVPHHSYITRRQRVDEGMLIRDVRSRTCDVRDLNMRQQTFLDDVWCLGGAWWVLYYPILVWERPQSAVVVGWVGWGPGVSS